MSYSIDQELASMPPKLFCLTSTHVLLPCHDIVSLTAIQIEAINEENGGKKPG